MKTIFLTALALIANICSFSSLLAQDEYNPELLIPYNDHGKWGFSDTLGNIKIEPQFESASFFYKADGDGPLISYVSRDNGYEFYMDGKGILSPKGHKSHWSSFDPFLLENNLSIVQKDEKIGLFNYEKQKLVVEPENEYYIFDELNGYVYLSKDNAKGGGMVITSYDVSSGEAEKLKFVEVTKEIVDGIDGEEVVILFLDKRNKWYERSSLGWERSSYTIEDFLGKELDIDPRIKTQEILPPEKPEYGKLQEVFKFKYEDATRHSSINFGYRQYFQVMHKASGFGLVKNSEEVLPFSYDFIDIDYYNGFFFLMKDKKMGVHVPYTSYPTIEPKYDLIGVEDMLRVNDNWQFVIFNVKVNGMEAYLGENGVEYFNFD